MVIVATPASGFEKQVARLMIINKPTYIQYVHPFGHNDSNTSTELHTTIYILLVISIEIVCESVRSSTITYSLV